MLPTGEGERRWHWREMQLEGADPIPTAEPEERRVGVSWHDLDAGQHYVWSGTGWVSVPSD
jgi:hypothetical protein